MYQQLRGGTGRAVYFRPPRVKAEWISGSDRPRVLFGDQSARLCDVSLSGMLIDLSSCKSDVLDSAAPLEVSVNGAVLYRGLGVAVRVEERARGNRIGIKLLDAPADPHRLRQLARESLLRNSVAAGTSVYDGVPESYRRAIGESFLAMTHWRKLLSGREKELAGEQGDAAERIHELEVECEELIRRDWQRARGQAIEAAEDPAFESAESVQAAKRLTELVLTPVLSEGMIWDVAYRKPRGYPGDFELMNLMYEERRRGETAFSRIIHQLGTEERLASTVRSRRRLLAREILDAARKSCGRGEEEFRVINLGAGPAQELSDVVRNWDSPGRLVLTLIDQDEGALEFADRSLRLAGARPGGRVEVRCRHVAFGELLRDPRLLAELVGQDFIYSAGFFDYLPDSVASALLAGLILLLRDNGRVLVGNALDARDVKWVPEFVLDWHMIYRSQEQMLGILPETGESPRRRIVLDDSAAWQFLEVTPRPSHD